MPIEEKEIVKEFGRLLIKHDPNRKTLLTLFQHLKKYIVAGRDTYWRIYSPMIEEPLPDSQAKFWEYQFHYEQFTHPSRRLEPGSAVNCFEEDLVPLTKEEEILLASLLE